MSDESTEFDLGALLEQAQQMQAQLAEAQARAADAVVTGAAGGGVVTVEVSGTMEFRSVTISPDVVDPGDVEMLQDLVLAALRDATSKVDELRQGAVGGVVSTVKATGPCGADSLPALSVAVATTV